MWSSFKKLTIGPTKNHSNNGTPNGLQTMSRVLQNKFSNGVQYNMKIIIKGDRNVGKSCLFSRLQGQGFNETYIPSEEIQVTNIQWNYKATDDIVKVEVWDVVDKGKKRVLSDNLKLNLEKPIEKCNEETMTPALDAEFLNVYKNTNGVIMVMDITKNWTFEYIQREIEKVPSTVPVLILGNHCDMSHHRTVTPDHVLFFIETLKRSAPVRYAESSMSNGFGLKFLHKWFNLPFLQLQRETLLAQLSTNENEIDITTQELDLYQQTDNSNYKVFLEKLTVHRRKVAESNSYVPPSSVIIQTQHTFSSPTVKLTSEDTVTLEKNLSCDKKSISIQNTINNNNECESNTKKTKNTNSNITSTLPDTSLKNIEEFMPDEHLDKSFLEEPTYNCTVNKMNNANSDSETESTGNPLVSVFQDDIDPDDIFSTKREKINTESRGIPDGRDDILKNGDNNQNSKKKTEAGISDLVKNRKEKKKKNSKKNSYANDIENYLNSDYEILD